MRKMAHHQCGTTDYDAGAARENGHALMSSPAFPADSEDTCIYQGDRPQPVCAFAHAVLLANFDSSTQESLELTLSRCRYRIVRPEAEGIFFDDLTNDELQQVDFLIFNLTHRSDETWRRFRRICSVRKLDGMPLMVQGWSRKYHGPEFHHDVEKLGARMEYA